MCCWGILGPSLPDYNAADSLAVVQWGGGTVLYSIVYACKTDEYTDKTDKKSKIKQN